MNHGLIREHSTIVATTCCPFHGSRRGGLIGLRGYCAPGLRAGNAGDLAENTRRFELRLECLDLVGVRNRHCRCFGIHVALAVQYLQGFQGEQAMSMFFREFMVAARETPRMYFAIFVGAFRGIQAELKAIEAQGKVN